MNKKTILKKIIFLSIFIFLVSLSLFTVIYSQNGFKSFYEISEFASNNVNNIKRIETFYKIKFKGLFNDEKIVYEFFYDQNNRLNRIFIREDSWGPLGESFYTMDINGEIDPQVVEFKFDSDFEKSYWHIIYQYYKDKIIFKELYKNQQRELKRENVFVADSLFLMEFLTFLNFQKFNKIDSTAYISFNAIKIPFGFKILKEEQIKTPYSKTFNTYLVEANASGFIGFLSYVSGNSGKFNLLKDFPHIRVYALYASKEYWLYDYKIEYNN
jgi:hypothetical protein